MEIPSDFKALNVDEPSNKAVGKMDKKTPVLFEHFRANDETALAQLFDQLRVETK